MIFDTDDRGEHLLKRDGRGGETGQYRVSGEVDREVEFDDMGAHHHHPDHHHHHHHEKDESSPECQLQLCIPPHYKQGLRDLISEAWSATV